MLLSKIIERLGSLVKKHSVQEDVEIDCLSADSKNKGRNGLFICLNGKNADGHNFIEEARRNGAIALVAEREVETDLPVILVKDTRKALGSLASVFYGEPTKRLKVIGITGTNGKTTTSYMVASILRAGGKKVGVVGTLGVVYGEKKIPTDLTTPDPIELHRCFAEMLKEGVEYAVMEVSAHALYYNKVIGVSFSACIFTNFTQDHLDFFSTMKVYKKAKLSLFSADTCPIAIVNGDDVLGREIGDLRAKSGAETLFYALRSPADCFAIITHATLKSTDCMLNLNDNLCRVRLPMIGEHNVYNALAAATCAEYLREGEGISEGLSGMEQVCGRLQSVVSYKGAEIFVDFAHTPDGLAKSLDTLKAYCQGRLVCLFGCGGNRDKSKRPIMGETVAKRADFALITSDNPRYEDPLDIISGIELGYRRFSTRYVIIPDRKKAMEYALGVLRKGDILLIAGKGGEEYQEIMGIKYPFNDQDMVEKLVKQKEKEGE